MKTYYELNGLQVIMIRKIAKRYETPWLRIKLIKNNRIGSKTIWGPVNRYKLKITGNHIASEIAFKQELKNNLVEGITGV